MRPIIHHVQQTAFAIRRYILALVLSCAVFGFTQWLGTWSAPVTFSLYVAAIVIGAYAGGRRAGIVGTVLAVAFLVWHYGFASGGRQIANVADLFPVLMPFAVMSILASHIASTSRQSVNLFANIHDTIVEMAEAVILADQRGQVSFLNQAAQKLTGWTHDDAFRKPIETVFRLLDGATRQPLPHPATLLLKGEKAPPRGAAAVLVAKDGTDKLIEFTAEPLRASNKVVTGVLLFFDDASQRGGADEELRQREAQFRAITAAAPAALMALDQNGECSYCNAACQTVLGFAAKEGLGSGWTRFVLPDDRPTVDQWKAAARQGIPFHKDCRFSDGPSNVRWIRIRADAARLDRGQYLGHVAILEDISPQKELERQLAERTRSEETLRLSYQEREAQFNKRIAALDEARTRLEKQFAEHDQTADSILDDHEQQQVGWRQQEAKLKQELERVLSERKQMEERVKQLQEQACNAADPRWATLDAAHKQLQAQLAGHEKAMEELLEEHTQKQADWQVAEAKLRQDLAGAAKAQQQQQRHLSETQEREKKLRQELDEFRTKHAEAVEHLQRGEQSWQDRLRDLDRQHAQKLAAHEQTSERLKFLADASHAFADTLEYEALLQKLPGAAMPTLGTVCAVFVVGSTKSPAPAALGSVQPGNRITLWNKSDLTCAGGTSWDEVAQLLDAAQPVLFEATPAALRNQLRQLPAFADRDEQEPSTALCVPLHIAGEPEGLVVFCRHREAPAFTAEELELAGAFIQRAALALTHARRHDAIRLAHADLALQHDAVSQSHEQLKQDHQKLHAVLASLEDGICVLDKCGTVLLVNAAGRALLEWSEVQEPVDRIEQLLPEATDDLAFLKSESQLVQTLEAGTALHRSHTLLRKSNGETVAVTCTVAPLVHTGEINGAVIAFRPASEQSQRMQSTHSKTPLECGEMEKLLARMSERCRPILREMWSAFAMLKENLNTGVELKEPTEALERRMRRLSRYLDRLATAIRVAQHALQLSKEPVDINAAVDRAVESIQPLVEERGHHLTVALPLFPRCIWADEGCLEQAIAILLENAALYTQRGGEIKLSVEHPADEIWVRVKDNGGGITPYALSHLMELSAEERKFWEGEGDGLGIGLALARSLVEAHGGTLTIVGTGPDRGSEFVLRWPAIAEGSAVDTASPPANGRPNAGAKREFVVQLT